MKSKYQEPIYITRVELSFYLFGKVKEKVTKDISDGNGGNYINIFEFEIWKNNNYIPELGDLVYYNKPYQGGSDSESLVIKSITYNYTHRKITFLATKKDFIASSSVLQSYSSNILRRTYNLVQVEDGFIVNHLSSFPSLPTGLLVDFMATFYLTNGVRVDYVNYERVDNNSIRLIIQENTTFTGTVTIERR
jgi:hypothetical protein